MIHTLRPARRLRAVSVRRGVVIFTAQKIALVRVRMVAA